MIFFGTYEPEKMLHFLENTFVKVKPCGTILTIALNLWIFDKTDNLTAGVLIFNKKIFYENLYKNPKNTEYLIHNSTKAKTICLEKNPSQMRKWRSYFECLSVDCLK